MSCRHAHLDGSYVLGALSPAERQDFEQHLATCPECARSVRELAGLPGLLSRADPEILTSPSDPDPVPDTLLPALVHEVRQARRRRAGVAAGAAAVAAAAAIALALVVPDALDSEPTGTPAATAAPEPTPSPVAGRAMRPLAMAPVTATVALERVAWGTRLDLTCTYTADREYGTPPPATYVLVVRTRDGTSEQVATWRSIPNRTMQLAGATAARPRDIVSVEVHTEDGTPVLRLAA